MTDDLATTLPLSALVNARFQRLRRSNQSTRGTGLWVGPFHGVKRGQGTDFDDLRNYSAGDEVRHLDWKVSARRGNLYTRLYREEKERVVTFVADFRSTMFTGSNELLSVTAGRLLAALQWQAIDAGSRVSMMTVSNEAIHSTRPASGHKSAIAACGLLASTFESARASASITQAGSTRKTDRASLTLALDKLLTMGRHVGTIVLASNFNDSKNFSESLTQLALARPVVAIHIDDPLCFDGLPTGRYRYIAHDNGSSAARTVQIRAHDRRRLADQLAKQHQQLFNVFEQAKVSLIDGRIGLASIQSELVQQGYLA